MALKKPKALNTGVTAEYWRIVQLNTNFDRLDCVIDLSVYLNQAARDAGASPLYPYRHDLGEAFAEKLYNGSDKVKNINLQKAYAELKLQAEAEAAKEEGDETKTHLE